MTQAGWLRRFGDTTFAIVLTASFLAVALPTTLKHEVWRDEVNTWAMSQASDSIAELFHNTRYDSHPKLWHLIVYGLTRFTGNPLAMQLANLAFAAAAVFVFARFAPFSRLKRILFSFGYFPLYEYAAIARNYAVGVLLLFTFCVLWQRERRRYLVLAGILFLLAQTSLYGLMLSISLGAMVLAGLFLDRDRPSRASPGRPELALATLLFVAGVVVSLVSMLPPKDYYFASWTTRLELGHLLRTLATVWNSYVPLPKPTYHFWNTNFLSSAPVRALLSLPLIALAVFALRRKLGALVLYASGTTAMLLLIYTKYFGFLRHHGHLFLLLVASLWLARLLPDRAPAAPAPGRPARAAGAVLVWLILAAHVVAGFGASIMDWRHPFSGAVKAARFFREHRLQDSPIVGDDAPQAAAVAGLLEQPIYYPQSQTSGTFIIWDRGKSHVTVDELLRQTLTLAGHGYGETVLLTNYLVWTEGMPLDAVYETGPSIVHIPYSGSTGRETDQSGSDESFWVYLTAIEEWNRSMAEVPAELRKRIATYCRTAVLPPGIDLPGWLDGTNLGAMDFTGLSEVLSTPPAGHGGRFPAAVFWRVGPPSNRRNAFAYMNALASFAGGDWEFELLWVDLSRTVALYEVTSRRIPGREPRRRSQQAKPR